uniref:Uncharacterized protein n=1 Tax=Grapevine-associated sobemo-like virus 1 TaxID=2814415 RepID=A0A8F5MKQ1_9VIRU|nr:MAG: hypothetical protein [Grapevine-associated sobemo-like virus 1]
MWTGGAEETEKIGHSIVDCSVTYSFVDEGTFFKRLSNDAVARTVTWTVVDKPTWTEGTWYNWTNSIYEKRRAQVDVVNVDVSWPPTVPYGVGQKQAMAIKQSVPLTNVSAGDECAVLADFEFNSAFWIDPESYSFEVTYKNAFKTFTLLVPLIWDRRGYHSRVLAYFAAVALPVLPETPFLTATFSWTYGNASNAPSQDDTMSFSIRYDVMSVYMALKLTINRPWQDSDGKNIVKRPARPEEKGPSGLLELKGSAEVEIDDIEIIEKSMLAELVEASLEG